MKLFEEIVKPFPGMRVLDIGGTASIWKHIDVPLSVTCLNLHSPDKDRGCEGPHKFSFLVGDGCSIPQFNPGDFDLVFSNSVIEHVGNYAKQQSFASEVLRLSTDYWIQTPHKWFPVEVHCGIPFWWF